MPSYRGAIVVAGPEVLPYEILGSAANGSRDMDRALALDEANHLRDCTLRAEWTYICGHGLSINGLRGLVIPFVAPIPETHLPDPFEFGHTALFGVISESIRYCTCSPKRCALTLGCCSRRVFFLRALSDSCLEALFYSRNCQTLGGPGKDGGLPRVVKAKNMLAYTGASMQGTLFFGDRLLVQNTSIKDIHPGDVVVFQRTGCAYITVHRVRRISSTGLKTQGDACSRPDTGYVTESNLQGKVVRVVRDNAVVKISDGLRGRIRAATLRYKRFLKIHFLRLFQPYYLFLGRIIVFAFRWNPSISCLHLNTPYGVVTKYVHNKNTIATWNNNTGHWECRRFYDLIIRKPAGKETNQ